MKPLDAATELGGPVVDAVGRRCHRHRRPELAQRACAGEADAPGAAGTGDERDPAVQGEERHQLPRGGVVVRASSASGSNQTVRFIPAARPLPLTTSAILRDASSIISLPIMTAPRLPPASEV